MVDPVGSRTTLGGGTIGRVSPVAGVAPASAKTVAAGPVEAPGTLARNLASSAPVDAERVAQIKAAVAAGRFPISPAKIADRLIALKLQWESTDASS